MNGHWSKPDGRTQRPRWKPEDDGWRYLGTGDISSMRSIETPDIGYCRQLVTDGLAEEAVDGFIIPWSSVYSLLGDNAHDTYQHCVARVAGGGTVGRGSNYPSRSVLPSDPTFAIGVSPSDCAARSP